MSQQIENIDLIRQYLLGELSAEEHERIEQRLLTDADYYQQVLIVENELIYEFVCDELPDQEKASFERHVLPVPERRQDVQFARALRKYVAENSPRTAEANAVAPVAAASASATPERASWRQSIAAFFRSPSVALALSVLLLLAISAAVWLGAQNRLLQNELAQLQARQTPGPASQNLEEQLASERRRNADLTEQLLRQPQPSQPQPAQLEPNPETANQRMPQPPAAPVPTPAQNGATVAAVLLLPGGVRDNLGEGVSKVTVPRGVRRIPLELDLAVDDYRGYRATLKSVGGQRELLSRKLPRARRGAGRVTVALNIPAELLARGDYQIELSGETSSGEYELIDTYHFRVVK